MHLAFDEKGYAVIEEVLDARQCEALAGRVSMGTMRVGSRNLLDDAWCVELALGLKGNAEIAAHLPAAALRAATRFGPAVARGGAGASRRMRPGVGGVARGAGLPSKRSALHLLFGPPELPHGLRWNNAV